MSMDATKFSVVRSDFSPDMNDGVVTISYPTSEPNEAHEFLSSMAAKQVAIAAAARAGIHDPRLSNSPVVYPVDAKGARFEDPRTQKVVGFHADIPVVRQLLS